MNITILGSSPSFANPGGASSGYLVHGGNSSVLVDCGHGVVGRLRAASDLRALKAIVISHMHPDHIFDLVPLTYAFRFLGLARIPLYLPPGGSEVLARLQEAMDLGVTFFTNAFAVSSYDPARGLDFVDFSVSLAPTRHFQRGYAMRFAAAAGRASIFYSSDTGWSDAVLDLARGATLALIEATMLQYERPDDGEGHLTAALAGQMGHEAGVEHLVLIHYASSQAEQLQREAEKTFGGPVALAREGESFSVE